MSFGLVAGAASLGAVALGAVVLGAVVLGAAVSGAVLAAGAGAAGVGAAAVPVLLGTVAAGGAWVSLPCAAAEAATSIVDARARGPKRWNRRMIRDTPAGKATRDVSLNSGPQSMAIAQASDLARSRQGPDMPVLEVPRARVQA